MTQLIKGTIRGYQSRRVTGEFFFAPGDKDGAYATAVAASAAGLSGVGPGLLLLAEGTEEEADLAEFALGDKKVEALVWSSPFKDGDEVEVVVERQGDVYKGLAIARPADRVVALYPHCSRGRNAHWRFSFSVWWKVMVFIYLLGLMTFFLVSLVEPIDWPSFMPVLIGGYAAALVVGAIIGYRVSNKFMPRVRLAEGIFTAFGWADPQGVDLPKRSKDRKRPSDSEDFGTAYFRY